MIPWRPIVTVTAITVFGVTALIIGQVALAAAAGGALIGYLGKVNGQTSNPAP